MTYEEALAWLGGLGRFGVQLGTERVAEVLARLGDGQRRFRALHIAGTNGKGSTAALCAAVLVAAGRRARAAGAAAPPVGLYTSPHLLRLTERARLEEPGGALAECPPAELGAALGRVRAAAARAPAQTLTFFEAVTAAAFSWFAERGAGLVVVETGLGGRLDATRLCQADAACVTSVGLDHTEWLGPTLAHIAREKAGVFRPGAPALVACDDAAARAALVDEAARAGAALFAFGNGWPAGVGAIPPLPAELGAAVPLPGAHQLRNGALALALARCAPPPWGPLAADPAVQRQGLAAARWPGRLERLAPGAGDPRPGGSGRPGPEIWVDAAHNPEGAAALEAWLATRAQPLTALFGVVQDKDAAGMLGPIRRAASLVLCRPPSPRGRAPAELLPLVAAAGYGGAPPRVIEEVGPALDAAREATPAGGLLLAYGSLFLVAEVRRLVLGEAADPVALQDPLRPVPTDRVMNTEA